MSKSINLINAVNELNNEYQADNKYSIVAASIKKAEKAAKEVNTEKHNELFEKCASVSDFLLACKVSDTVVKLDSAKKAFEIANKESMISITDWAAYRNANHTKDGKGNVLPETFRKHCLLALATLAATVAATTENVDFATEKARIEKKYNVSIDTASKKFARPVLHSLANLLVPGTKVSGGDLTKVMLSVFTVNTLTWKVRLPKEETLYKVFTAMMNSIMTRGEVVDGVFEDVTDDE